MDRFIADLHLGDKKNCKKRGFNNFIEMNDKIVKEWNIVTSDEDNVFLLGDVAVDPKYYPILKKLNGNIYVLLGNHEKIEFIPELTKYVKGMTGLYKYSNEIYLSHCPVHECQIGTKVNLNIHGHIHKNNITAYMWDYNKKEDKEIPHPNYINVSVDNIGYTPLTLNQLTR